VGNQYTHVSNPKELDAIKMMMDKAGYDTWEHTNADQIKYIKKSPSLSNKNSPGLPGQYIDQFKK
jgi:hypothetical protein